MLTLAGSLRVDRFAIYRDIVRHADAWIKTPIFYVVPDSPSIARDARGAPLFDFLWYRALPAAAGTGAPAAGGILTVTTTLAPRPDEIDILRAQLADRARRTAARPLDPIASRGQRHGRPRARGRNRQRRLHSRGRRTRPGFIDW